MAWETDFLGARFDVSGMSRNARRYALEPPRCGHSNGAGHTPDTYLHTVVSWHQTSPIKDAVREGCLAVEKPHDYRNPVATAHL